MSHPSPTISKQVKGARAEEAVARLLRRRGFRILRRNYACPMGELDIVAQKGEWIAFVEVRSAQRDTPIPPAQTVTLPKRRRIVRAARAFVREARAEHHYLRFDVAQVWLDEKGKPREIDYIEGAFDESGE